MNTATDNANYLIGQARAAGITDKRELAIFMGQMQIESGAFRSMHEGLGYRPERLLEIFGPYTDRKGIWHDGRNGLTNLDEARAITARGPQGIAEAIYGGHWGARNLGNIEPGDGWKYHGRGYVQLTGRDNYAGVGQALGLDLVNNPDLAADRQVAARIAIHYWQDRVRANGHQLDVRSATRDINGGENHLAERRSAATAWERKFDQGYLDHLTQPGSAASHAPVVAPGQPTHPGPAAIYDEAYRHFLANGNRFEYGRGDLRLRNGEGNGQTDTGRNEQDADGDGLRGVDCSSFVWRGLKNSGYNVAPNTPAHPFTTHGLFNGHAITNFARQNFDVIAAADVRRDHGNLKRGDILLFKDKDSGGQHVGIFKGYDTNGRIQFIGSQVDSGPAQATAGQGSYWNGGEFEIVAALRAKPEFQVRPPFHATQAPPAHSTAPEQTSVQAARQTPAAALSADADGQLRLGEKGAAVATLQRRLFELDYRAKDGRPLKINGDFGGDTLFALQQFQRQHGLEGKGVAGPKTAAALDRAEASLMTHPSHPQHALYEQALAKVQAAEKAKGIPVGPHSERVAAALVVECLREGLTRIDRVAISDTGKLAWAIEDRPRGRESGLGRTDGISLAQAANQPLAESSQQAHQVAVNVREQHQADLARRPTQPAPAVAH